MWVEQPRVRTQWLAPTIISLALLLSNVAVVVQAAAGEGTGHYTDVVTPNGRADWTTGIVTAKGIGIPPKNPASALQAKEMARTAAWAVALRNLLESVKGVYVDSTTTVCGIGRGSGSPVRSGWPPVDVLVYPVSDDLPRLLNGLKRALPDTLLFETMKEPLNDPVLFRHMEGDELMLQTVVAQDA